MDKKEVVTFEHFMAMYYCNFKEKPTRATLRQYSNLYRTMKIEK